MTVFSYATCLAPIELARTRKIAWTLVAKTRRHLRASGETGVEWLFFGFYEQLKEVGQIDFSGHREPPDADSFHTLQIVQIAPGCGFARIKMT